MVEQNVVRAYFILIVDICRVLFNCQRALKMPGYCCCLAADKCRCGEEQQVYEWKWEKTTRVVTNTHFKEDNREVTFQRVYSTGTAVVRGTKGFVNDHHYYWEIKIITALYGTDVMIGVGTEDVNFGNSIFQFMSFLGLDSESYGFSYTGKVQHEGNITQYCRGFGQGDIVGVYLDMWNGTIEYYINRKPMGIAFRGLKRHKKLYPMVCSTASHSIIRLTYCMSCPMSLELQSGRMLAQSPYAKNIVQNVPGYRNHFQKAFWILLPTLNTDEELIFDEETHCDKLTNRAQSLFSRGKRENCSKFDCEKFCKVHCKSKVIRENNDETILKNSSPSDDAEKEKRNDEVWLAALGSSSYEMSEVESDENNMVLFTSHLRQTAMCQICKSSVAVAVNQTTLSQKCLECFYRTCRSIR